MNGTRSDREAIRTRHNVTVHGAGEKVLLLAHGFGCYQRMWRPVLPALAERHTVVMFDYVGSGNSELASFSIERYSSLDGYAFDVLEIIQAFELERVTFVGHSVSAMIGADRVVAGAGSDRCARHGVPLAVFPERSAEQRGLVRTGRPRGAARPDGQELQWVGELPRAAGADLQSFCERLSHDFAGPLGLIHQLIEMGLEDLRNSGVEAPDDFELLETAGQNAKVLVGLTQGLVQYLVADVTVALNERLDLDDIVSSVLTLRQDPDASGAVVHRDALPTIVSSEAQLQVLFKNLIDNAIKYNERTPEITISHAPHATTAGRVVISVADNGIGMAANQLQRVFEPFARLNRDDRYPPNGDLRVLGRTLDASDIAKIIVKNAKSAWQASSGRQHRQANCLSADCASLEP